MGWRYSPPVSQEFWQRFKGGVPDSSWENFPASGTCRCSPASGATASGRRKVKWCWDGLYSHPSILPNPSTPGPPKIRLTYPVGTLPWALSYSVWAHYWRCVSNSWLYIPHFSECSNCPFQFSIKPLLWWRKGTWCVHLMWGLLAHCWKLLAGKHVPWPEEMYSLVLIGHLSFVPIL